MSTKCTSSTICPLAPNQSNNIASDLHGSSNEPAIKQQFLDFENSRTAGKCHTAEILLNIQDVLLTKNAASNMPSTTVRNMVS